MNRLNFWLIWSVGLLPVLLAMLMYFYEIMLPSQRSHHGELVAGQNIENWQLKSVAPGRQWRLLLTTQTGQCVKSCEQWWQALGQIHIALGKDQNRVGVDKLDFSATDLTAEQFTQLGDAIWVVDPLGNLVLRYSFEQSPAVLLKDLRKLLKVSRIG